MDRTLSPATLRPLDQSARTPQPPPRSVALTAKWSMKFHQGKNVYLFYLADALVIACGRVVMSL